MTSNGATLKVHRKIQKFCVGDHVTVSHNNAEHHGVIRFIGPTHLDWTKLYYGIDLSEGCGDHDGVLPDHKKRPYFKCRRKHGIFVLQKDLLTIQWETAIRITVNDRVNVTERGSGIVRFIGEMAYISRGIFYGIELDQKKRYT